MEQRGAVSFTPPSSFDTLSAEQVALVNDVCDRFERDWREGRAPSIKDHLAAAPEWMRNVAAQELVLIDAAYREKRFGEVDREVYERILGVDSEWLGQKLTTGAMPGAGDRQGRPPDLPRYEILKEIGRGGMGVVHQARDRRLGRLVCLKSLRRDAWGRPDRLARLRREAHALSALNHPNICTLFELEEHAGAPALVFEWVDGKTFREVGRESDRTLCLTALFVQTARALASAHAAKVVHRDIKPENLMVRTDGVVKVLDFGLARLDDTELLSSGIAEGQTAEGALLGTAKYMSPEQATGRRATAASDIFSLGVVIFELATGRHPFAGDHMAAVLNAIVEYAPPPAIGLNPNLDPRLAALIDRMLDKRPEGRPAAEEVVATLDELIRDGGFVAASASMGAGSIPRCLVGREAELRELRIAYDEALASRGSAVFVNGEPGIGKTTLLEEFGKEAVERRGALLLHGRCSQRLSTSDAYLPILDALSHAIGGPHATMIDLALETAAPAWSALLSSSTDALGRVMADTGSLTSGRLKREFRALLDALSQRQAVIVLLDDIKWADESTIDLLGYLGHELQRMPLLLLGAYRPADAADNLPFERLRREFVARSWGHDLKVSFLGRDAIGQLLKWRFPDRRVSEDLAGFLQQRTEGNPLFLNGLVESLIERGVFGQDDGARDVDDRLSALDQETPDSIDSVIKEALEGLDQYDHRLLQVASVQGIEFDASVVADAMGAEQADVEDILQRLARRRGLIGPGVEQELPDGVLTHRHRFVHVLYQETLYKELTPARRAKWSLKIAAVLEHVHARRPDDIALELAFLYEAGRDFASSVANLQRVAQRDVRIGACHEAAAACRRSLELIAKTPHSAERDKKELELQFASGFAESLARGYGSQQSQHAYERAEALCLRQDAAPESFSVLHGLWAYRLTRMDAEKLAMLGDRLVELAKRVGSAAHAFAAHSSLGLTLLQQGALERAEAQLMLAEAAGDYLPDDDRRFITQMCMPFGPLFYCTRSWLRQLQGQDAEALKDAQNAVEWGATLGTPQFQVDSWFATLHYLRHDAKQALSSARQMLDFARRTDFESYLRQGTVIEAWAAAELAEEDGRQTESRVDSAMLALSSLRSQGVRASTPVLMCMVGEALAKLGRMDEARAAFMDSLAFGRESGERWWEAETLRQLGLLTERSDGGSQEARGHIRDALALSRTQGAVELERRCAIVLARMGG